MLGTLFLLLGLALAQRLSAAVAVAIGLLSQHQPAIVCDFALQLVQPRTANLECCNHVFHAAGSSVA
jgi:uncharacterized membrane protein YdcZ (DUF606 family)